jgi:hypothetical protein
MTAGAWIKHQWPRGLVRRFLVFAAIAFWLGGFTFYAGVVIPIGMQVLGGHLRQGFITQRVTECINIAALCAIPILCWNTAANWGRTAKLVRYGLGWSLIVIALIQAELLVLHPYLDRLLDVKGRSITDEGRFDLLHHIYLLSATAQWGAGVLHVLCIAAAQTDSDLGLSMNVGRDSSRRVSVVSKPAG